MNLLTRMHVSAAMGVIMLRLMRFVRSRFRPRLPRAIAFNALRKAFEAADTVILGVSADPVKAQDKFRDKYSLAFPLASDEPTRCSKPTASGARKAFTENPSWESSGSPISSIGREK